MKLIHIRKYCAGLLLAGSLGVVSCANETEADRFQNQRNVEFSAEVNPVSRVTDSAWDGGEQIGVKVGETVKVYTVASDGKMSTTEDPYVWEGTGYDVLAWSPLTSEKINLKDQSTQKKFFDCDLLSSNATVAGRVVRLTFKHRMTRMWWELQVFEGYSQAEADAATISFIGHEVVTYAEGVITPVGNADCPISSLNFKGEYYRNGEAMLAPGERWGEPLIRIEIGGDEYIYTPSRENANDVAKKTGDLKAGAWQRYYLSISKKSLSVEMKSEAIDWEDEQIGKDQIVDAKFKATIASEVTAQDGYATTGLDTDHFITDGHFTIAYREAGQGGLNYAGSCKMERTIANGIHTYTFSEVASDIQVSYAAEYIVKGDYYYSDGTWGSEPEKAECTTLGRVFKVGRHDTDKATYAGLDKVRGYVVCTVSDETGYAWVKFDGGQPEAAYKPYFDTFTTLADANTKNATDYLGYTFTSYLRETLADVPTENLAEHLPVWGAFRSKEAALKAPATTSGWYIPSLAQLKEISASGVWSGFAGEYVSSNVYAEGDLVWVMLYDASAKTYKGGWASDARKLILVFTF